MKHAIYFAMLVAICTMFGCGGKNIKKTDYVEGTITYKGVPVEGASIGFSPMSSAEGASPAYGRTDTQGKYVIQTQGGASGKGTTPGEYRIIISKTNSIPTGKKTTYPDGSVYEEMKHEDVLPKMYGNVSTTPLTATVVSGGPNKFDFDLVDKP